jgi:hypothetical protein
MLGRQLYKIRQEKYFLFFIKVICAEVLYKFI